MRRGLTTTAMLWLGAICAAGSVMAGRAAAQDSPMAVLCSGYAQQWARVERSGDPDVLRRAIRQISPSCASVLANARARLAQVERQRQAAKQAADERAAEQQAAANQQALWRTPRLRRPPPRTRGSRPRPPRRRPSGRPRRRRSGTPSPAPPRPRPRRPVPSRKPRSRPTPAPRPTTKPTASPRAPTHWPDTSPTCPPTRPARPLLRQHRVDQTVAPAVAAPEVLAQFALAAQADLFKHAARAEVALVAGGPKPAQAESLEGHPRQGGGRLAGQALALPIGPMEAVAHVARPVGRIADRQSHRADHPVFGRELRHQAERSAGASSVARPAARRGTCGCPPGCSAPSP